MLGLNIQPSINLLDELNAINKENALKKKLQNNIKLTYMSESDSNKKIESLKIFQQIQIYIKRMDLDKLKEYMEKNVKSTTIKNSEDKIEYKNSKKIETGQLENSKDRLLFLNKLITSQSNGYDPVKNYMQQYRMKNKVIQERKARERNLRLQFLKTKELKREKSKLISTANRLNRAKEIRQQEKIRRNMKEEEKKKEPVENTVIKFEKKKIEKTGKEKRKDNITYKDGDITDNCDILLGGMYELPEYSKAMVFKFNVNFNNDLNKVVDLIDIEGDLLLHMDIRDNKLIVLNSHIDNKWGKEIRVERVMEGEHEIKILVKNDFYKILDNNQVISFFVQRKNENIKFLNINVDVKKFVYKIM